MENWTDILNFHPSSGTYRSLCFANALCAYSYLTLAGVLALLNSETKAAILFAVQTAPVRVSCEQKDLYLWLQAASALYEPALHKMGLSLEGQVNQMRMYNQNKPRYSAFQEDQCSCIRANHT